MNQYKQNLTMREAALAWCEGDLIHAEYDDRLANDGAGDPAPCLNEFLVSAAVAVPHAVAPPVRVVVLGLGAAGMRALVHLYERIFRAIGAAGEGG